MSDEVDKIFDKCVKEKKETTSKFKPNQAVKDECKVFKLHTEQLKNIKDTMKKSIIDGLKKDTQESSSLKCFVTYVQDLPTGKEKGKFLAMDLGGTHFRILLAVLEAGKIKMESDMFDIPEEIAFSGTGIQLFDFLAKSIVKFRDSKKLGDKEKIPLGFTFSFPTRQLGLDNGVLTTWTKGFKTSGVVGENLVRLLRDALYRKKCYNVHVCAILNDTTGTMVAAAWERPNVRIGLIVGTGTNACYWEKTKEAELFEGDKSKPNVIINTEWGNFGYNGELRQYLTEFDTAIDNDSNNPGFQIFEKMISGLYQGELVRLLMVKLGEQKELFDGQVSDKLRMSGVFTGRHLTQLELKDDANHTKCFCLMQEALDVPITETDCLHIRYICKKVTNRAAKLVAAGLGALVDKMNEQNVVIAVDGSVYKYHTTFHPVMMKSMKKLLPSSIKFDIVLAEDGSGKGAALVAAATAKECLKKQQ